MNAELIKVNGHWRDIPLYASISHGIEKPKDPEGLLKRLYKWRHMEPFEFVSFVWKLEIPIFLERQLLRHRISSKVERSLRYVTLDIDSIKVWYPKGISESQRHALDNGYLSAIEAYEKLVRSGVPAAQARTVLPLGLYTIMFVSFNARSFDNFLRLRLDKHAQLEMRKLARMMLDTFKERPETEQLWKLWVERYLPGELEEEEGGIL